MKIGNPHRPVTSAWLTKEGHRLDAPPFLSGAVEARVLLDKLTVLKQPLREVTAGHNGGIYNGPQFKRNYVTSPEHGVPFLTGSGILLADASRLPMISRKDALSKKLAYLRVEEGMTLISCSGSIGKMAYARPELSGVWASQDVMKVVPNPEVIPSGYLYAYLSSRFGKTLVTGGTYGAIIQHIEPEHIVDLGVPRFGDVFENNINSLVIEAGNLRSEANKSIKTVNRLIEERFKVNHGIVNYCSVISSNRMALENRMDGYYFNPEAEYLSHLIRSKDHALLSDISEVYDVPPFKHIYVDSGLGTPFLTSSDIFKSDLRPELHLSNTKTKGLQKYMIPGDSILLARSGQIGGNIGRGIPFHSFLEGFSTSDHVIRIVPKKDVVHYGYLFAFLNSEIGYKLLIRHASGKSIPALWPVHIQNTPIPRMQPHEEESISNEIVIAFEKRAKATLLEVEAIHLVEQAIEQNYVPPEV